MFALKIASFHTACKCFFNDDFILSKTLVFLHSFSILLSTYSLSAQRQNAEEMENAWPVVVKLSQCLQCIDSV